MNLELNLRAAQIHYVGIYSGRVLPLEQSWRLIHDVIAALRIEVLDCFSPEVRLPTDKLYLANSVLAPIEMFPDAKKIFS